MPQIEPVKALEATTEPPQRLVATTLTWVHCQSETVEEFLIERSFEPLTGFAEFKTIKADTGKVVAFHLECAAPACTNPDPARQKPPDNTQQSQLQQSKVGDSHGNHVIRTYTITDQERGHGDFYRVTAKPKSNLDIDSDPVGRVGKITLSHNELQGEGEHEETVRVDDFLDGTIDDFEPEAVKDGTAVIGVRITVPNGRDPCGGQEVNLICSNYIEGENDKFRLHVEVSDDTCGDSGRFHVRVMETDTVELDACAVLSPSPEMGNSETAADKVAPKARAEQALRTVSPEELQQRVHELEEQVRELQQNKDVP